VYLWGPVVNCEGVECDKRRLLSIVLKFKLLNLITMQQKYHKVTACYQGRPLRKLALDSAGFLTQRKHFTHIVTDAK
jgi:hypothetical protein